MVGVGSIGNPDAFEGLLCGALLGLIMGIAACLAVESLMLGAAVLGSLAGFPLAGLILQFEFLEMFAWEILVGSLVAGGVAGMGLCQWLTRSKDESPTPVFVAGLLIALFTGLAGGLSLTLIEYI
jgi:hypothetical protein